MDLFNQQRILQTGWFGCQELGARRDLIDYPQVAGATGVAVVFAKMVELFIFPDASQTVME